MRATYIVGLGALLVLVVYAAPVQAQIFIAANGKDTNDCGRAAPCRTLQRGVDATRGGRVLTILDSGDYGIATIRKSITITADGVSANIRAPSGASAITINHAAATVVLRGLFLTGGGVGTNGINIRAAAAVHIENCVVERFTSDGILLDSGAELFISNTVSRENGVNGLQASGATATLTVGNSRFENNDANGILQSGGTANVTRTTAANNGMSGYRVLSSGTLTLESSVARGNGDSGLFVHTSTALISNLLVTYNINAGIYQDSSVIRSRQNNTVFGNFYDNVPGDFTPLGGV